METKFKVGDKIVVCNNFHKLGSNTYDRDGQTGYIEEINKHTVLINFNDNTSWLKRTIYKDSIQHYIETKQQNMKTVVLPIEIARKMYLNSKDESVREFALSNYSKEELETKELPKSWKELKTISGCFYNDSESDNNQDFLELVECTNTVTKMDTCKLIYPTKSLAEAALSLSQLLQLREVYRNGWIPDYNSVSMKWSIRQVSNNFEIISTYDKNRVFSFQSKEIVQQFLSNFEELLEIAKPLI